jgi:hypothetical protein
MALSRYERRQIVTRFAARLVNYDHLLMYWRPSTREIIGRSAAASSTRRSIPAPADAILIGSYARPFCASTFIEDLEDVIAKLELNARAAAA